jgi:uncharacterized tellurite resistance protein B-like protein
MEQLSADPNRFWVKPGTEVPIAGRIVPGGFIYVGSALASARNASSPEPSLIDPTLSTETATSETVTGAGVPTYGEMTPAERGSYLDWLSSGRSDSAAAEQFVMLYFFGLERRLLVDHLEPDRERDEVPQLLQELARLLGAYSHYEWFARQAEELQTLVRVVRGYQKAYDFTPGIEQPLDNPPPLTAIALGQLAAEGRPIPASWALAWLSKDPSSRFRFACSVCPKEFRRLFEMRYSKLHGAGLLLKQRRRLSEPIPDFTISYVPVSPSFDSAVHLSLGPLLDVTATSDAPRSLRSLADDCASDLSEYSRWAERFPRSRGSLAARKFLPPELSSARQSLEEASLSQWLKACLSSDECVLVEAESLLKRLFSFVPEGLGKKEVFRVIELLQEAGFGIEPDVRFSAPALETFGKIAVFSAAPGSITGESRGYAATAALLHLAVAVAAADDEVTKAELQKLQEHLAKHLPENERTRLLAHLRWLEHARPSLGRIKSRLEPLDRAQREEIGQFLIALAGADGHVTNEETKILAKIYPLLGLDPEEIYGHILGLAVQVAKDARGDLPSVRAAELHAEFALPQGPNVGVLQLDSDKIQEKLGQTAAVSVLLTDVFADDDNDASLVPNRLDDSLTAMVRALGERSSWSRPEIEDLATRLGVMPDGALERINERAWELCGEPACEGENPVQIHAHVVKELLG